MYEWTVSTVKSFISTGLKQDPTHPNPILSSKQFPSNTDGNCSQPMEVQAVRALVPTFIRENEEHFIPRWQAKSPGTARRRYHVANLSVHSLRY